MRLRWKETWPRTPRDAWLLWRVFWMLHRYRRHSLTEGLPSLLEGLTPHNPANPAQPDRLDRVTRYVDALCYWLPYLRKDACMPRSLTLYHFARQFGIPAQWQCGVRKSPDRRLEGHAWLTQDGALYLEVDQRARDYSITFRYPPDAQS